MNSEVTRPLKITERGAHDCSAPRADRKHFRMTLLLRERKESVPVDSLRAARREGKRRTGMKKRKVADRSSGDAVADLGHQEP